MASFDPALDTCPSCHSKGNCVLHKTYRRYLIDYYHGKCVCHLIRVTVVRCSSCGAYHSILPDVIIPYQSYSLFFILHVLDYYFNHRDSIRGICERFGLQPPTIYRWKKLFLKHKRLWLGVLENHLQDADRFLSHIRTEQDFSQFSSDFIQRFVLSFLQSHKMQYRQCPLSP